jgi:hypothetical protein
MPSRRVKNTLASCIATLNAVDDGDHNDDEALCNAVVSSLDPTIYAAAIRPTEAQHWRTAIESELKSLRDNRTWVVADKLQETKP